MRFNPGAFNSWLGNIGQKFTWRKAYSCPCVNPHSSAAKPNCPQCDGKGQIWVAAVPAVAGMAGQKVQREWAQFGLWQSGDAVITIPENSPMYEMGQFDRVVMLNSTDYFSRVLTSGSQTERLSDPVERIDRVFWLDAQSNIVEGSIPTVNSDGSLTFPNGGINPPAGTQYTITGTRFSEYFCWGMFPSDRNEHQGMRLPKRVVLRRFDLFSR